MRKTFISLGLIFSFSISLNASAAVMTIKDAAGKTLVSQGVPMAWRTTDGNRPIGSLSIPGTDKVAWVVGTLGTWIPLLPRPLNSDSNTISSGPKRGEQLYLRVDRNYSSGSRSAR